MEKVDVVAATRMSFLFRAYLSAAVITFVAVSR